MPRASLDGFGAGALLPVRAPFRLDLTAEALRRLASNAVDVIGEDGTYYRALHDAAGTSVVAVRAHGDDTIDVRASGRDGERWWPLVARMLGTQADMTQWRKRSARVPWLKRVSRALDGVKPPRYASAWEACCHAIVFQQISIYAAASIMRRVVEHLGEPVEAEGVRCVPFPRAERLLEEPEAALRACGLSANKVAHLRSVAAACLDGTIDEEALERLPTAEAAEALTRVRGIGPWSAAVVMLRGFGRLDVFPMRDSGVARTVKALSGDAELDLDALLEILGPVRGMLYYHLLLGRLRNLTPG
jgi:DNA-3-methyladenine glycosylase II